MRLKRIKSQMPLLTSLQATQALRRNVDETLHSMIYYSKNLSLAECNYKIYDKKLLTIIHVFKHWWSELKLTELLIKMFTDHQALTSLMKDKELSKR